MIINKKLAINSSVLTLTAIISTSLLPLHRPELKRLGISSKGRDSNTGKGRITKDTSNLCYFRLSEPSSNSLTHTKLSNRSVPGENKPKLNIATINTFEELPVSKSNISPHCYKKKNKLHGLDIESEKTNRLNQTHLIPSEQLIIIDPKKYAPFFRPYPRLENKKYRKR